MKGLRLGRHVKEGGDGKIKFLCQKVPSGGGLEHELEWARVPVEGAAGGSWQVQRGDRDRVTQTQYPRDICMWDSALEPAPPHFLHPPQATLCLARSHVRPSKGSGTYYVYVCMCVGGGGVSLKSAVCSLLSQPEA